MVGYGGGGLRLRRVRDLIGLSEVVDFVDIDDYDVKKMMMMMMSPTFM